VEKHSIIGQAIFDYNMAHALYILDYQGCRNTLRIINTGRSHFTLDSFLKNITQIEREIPL